MKTPPNLKRRLAVKLGAGLEDVVEPPAWRIAPEKDAFSFTELQLTESELDGLSVIPSRAPAVAASWAPLFLLDEAIEVGRPLVPLARRAGRKLGLAMAVGMTWASLPGCARDGAGGGDAVSSPPSVSQAYAPRRCGFTLAGERATAEVASPAQVKFEVVNPARQVAARARAVAPRVAAVATRAMIEAAQAQLDREHFRAALALYLRVLKASPADVDALFGAALASTELGEAKSARGYLARVLALQPDHPRANILAGFGAQLARRYGSAREHYARYLKAEPEGKFQDEIRSVVRSLPGGGASKAGSR